MSAANHPTRRQFLKTSALGLALGGSGWGCASDPVIGVGDPFERELALLALDEATKAGANYADVRVSRHWFEAVRTREQQITGANFTESYGIGIRTLVGGSWGFSGTRELTNEAVARAAREATAIAAANDRIAPQKTELAPVDVYPAAEWTTPHEIDPFDVPLEEKADLLFAASAEAMTVNGVRFVTGSIMAVKERRLVATTRLWQTGIR